eukprot:jgi/Tetstr1/465878/TSEL_010495.t1
MFPNRFRGLGVLLLSTLTGRPCNVRPGRLRGMRTHFVGATGRHCTTSPGCFRGLPTQLVGTNGPRLYHAPAGHLRSPDTQLVGANESPLHDFVGANAPSVHPSPRSLPQPGNAAGRRHRTATAAYAPAAFAARARS